ANVRPYQGLVLLPVDVSVLPAPGTDPQEADQSLRHPRTADFAGRWAAAGRRVPALYYQQGSGAETRRRGHAHAVSGQHHAQAGRGNYDRVRAWAKTHGPDGAGSAPGRLDRNKTAWCFAMKLTK